MELPHNSIRFMAFSDWRVQNIEDVITFLDSLENPPDFILYSGDDVDRFWDGETNYFSKIAEYSTSNIVLAVIGNDDTHEIKPILQGEHIHDLHETPYVYKDYCFMGLEGSTSRPGIIVYSEEHVFEHLKNQLQGNQDKRKIIVSHPPPFGILDKGIRFAENDKGYHNIGSTALLEHIQTNDIQLVVCGHCHSHGGLSQKHNDTIVVNVASHDNSGAEGRFALIDIYPNGECDVEWHSTKNMIPSDSLLNLYGIGFKRNQQFQEAGINNIQDLIKCKDIEHVSSISGFSTLFLRKSQYRAKSKEEIKIYQIGSINLPIKPIFLDIETDISCKNVWLIGLLEDGQYSSLYANTWDEESEILSNLIELIKKRPDSCLISYSGTGFDKNVLQRAIERNKLDTEYFSLYPHYDLCQTIRRNYIFPHNNFKLKELGAFLGYNFQHQEFDGFKVALAYHEHINSNEPLDKKYLEYNEDDVRSTEYLYNLIKNNEIDSETILIGDSLQTCDLFGYSEADLITLIQNQYKNSGRIYTRFDKRYGGYSLELRFYTKQISELNLLRNAMIKFGFSEGSVVHSNKAKRVYVPYYGKTQTVRFIQKIDPPLSDRVKTKLEQVI
jgi:Icc-related predicted phosphoesterase/uncharacterized protein YprB with RNaseH-like and TPR domain